MSRRIVLLRAVNVGGRSLAMAALRRLLVREGYAQVSTLGASGNAVVEASSNVGDAAIEARVEAALAGVGLETAVLVRGVDEWTDVIARNPFVVEARDDPSHLVVTALRASPDAAAWARLRASIVGPERVAPGGRHAYIVYPDGIGRSKLTAIAVERHLGTVGTSRNWNTVTSLLRLCR